MRGRRARGEEVRKVMRTMRCKHCGADYHGGRCIHCGSDEFVDVEGHYNPENMTIYREDEKLLAAVSGRSR